MSANTAGSSHAAWVPTAAAIALVMAATLWLYRDTAVGMWALWGQSETFAHGYIVPLISAWLVWRQRNALAAIEPAVAPAPLVLIMVSIVAAVWFIGDLASVNPVTQFALVALIALSVPALAGWRAARVILFPLAFLFFAVPFGEFLLPWLMARTADFTVVALRASGLPVYRDGLQFVIPTGTWSVVEACSGVRYLIASLMVGALFAYLNYRSIKRRLLFMLVALAVPIVANWLRAYMIVMIGHLSGNTLAVGVDHLIYGWLFFGVVIGIMFMIGARWSEAPAEIETVKRFAGSGPAFGAGRRLWIATATMLFVLALPLLVLRVLAASNDPSAPQLAAPAIAGDAALTSTALAAWTPAWTNPSATLERRYVVQGQAVGLYLGYYRAQGPDRKLVSSSNALVRSDDKAWMQAGAGRRDLALGERHISLKTASLRRPVSSSDTTRLVAWHTYWVDGRFEASDVRAKAWGAWQRLRGRGDDGAVLIVYAQEQSPGDADVLLEAFLREQLAAVEAQLKKTRHGD